MVILIPTRAITCVIISNYTKERTKYSIQTLDEEIRDQLQMLSRMRCVRNGATRTNSPCQTHLEHSYTELVHDGRCHPKNLTVPRAGPLFKQKMPKTILPNKFSYFASHDSTTSFSLLLVSVLFCISRSFRCSSSLSCALVSFTALGLLLVDC